MKYLLLVAAVLIVTSTPATTQVLKTYQCSRLTAEQTNTDKFGLTTRHYTVSAADPSDALVQCWNKVDEEKKRANRRVLRT